LRRSASMDSSAAVNLALCHAVQRAGGMMQATNSTCSGERMAVNVFVNDEPVRVDLPEDTPLLWVLRDHLGLTGTKFGCGMALCGACTVHVDGQPMRSCVTAIGTLRGKEIVTIEGLARNGDHPVQRAWIDEDVPQCGYCQPGFIMSAAALLKARPRPTAAEVDSALAGHICRCGTYNRVRKAVLRASAEMAASTPATTAPAKAAPAKAAPDSTARDKAAPARKAPGNRAAKDR
jgi:isoquinoline 1-oxidoreductase alpha subunit